MNSSFVPSPLVSFTSFTSIIANFDDFNFDLTLTFFFFSENCNLTMRYKLAERENLAFDACSSQTLTHCIPLQAVDFFMMWNKRKVFNRTVSGTNSFLRLQMD